MTELARAPTTTEKPYAADVAFTGIGVNFPRGVLSAGVSLDTRHVTSSLVLMIQGMVAVFCSDRIER
jgi:hypothetical protein